MPVIKSAKKKLRQDKKKRQRNKEIKNSLKELIKKAEKDPSEKLIKQLMSIADKAAKNHTIHKNKAARIKSTFAKLTTPAKEAAKSPAKKKTKTTSS